MSERTGKFILSFLHLAPVHVGMLAEYMCTHSKCNFYSSGVILEPILMAPLYRYGNCGSQRL